MPFTIGEEMENPVIAKVKLAGREQGWGNSSETLVAAVSGGGDSVALLAALLEIYRGKIVIAHVEHGIRGISSVSDSRFVEDIAGRTGLDSFVRSIPVPDLRHGGESMEEAARRLRYDFLEEIRRLTNAAWIAVGHNADDIVETIVFNLIRGTGIAGLCGLPGRRGAIVRPLLHCTRKELRDFLLKRGETWREDETNLDTGYSRNRIRHKLIPEIRDNYNPAFETRMLALRKNLLPYRDSFEVEGRNAALFLRRRLPLVLCAWDLKSLRLLEPASRAELLRFEASSRGLGVLDHSQMEKLTDLLVRKQGWRFQWEGRKEILAGGGFVALAERGLLELQPGGAEVLSGSSGCIRWGPGVLSWEEAGTRQPAFSDYTAILPIPSDGLVVLPSNKSLSGNALSKIPWFYRKCWPTIVFGDKMSWTPFWGYLQPVPKTDFPCFRVTFSPDSSLGES